MSPVYFVTYESGCAKIIGGLAAIISPLFVTAIMLLAENCASQGERRKTSLLGPFRSNSFGFALGLTRLSKPISTSHRKNRSPAPQSATLPKENLFSREEQS